MREQKDPARPETRTVVLSSSAVLVGIVLIIIFAPQSGGVASVLNTLGTTFLTIGLVSFVSEYLLRRALTSDLIRKIDLKQRLHASGVDDVAVLPEHVTIDVFRASRSNVIATIRPTKLLEQLWPEMEKECARNGAHFAVYMPDPDSAVITPLAHRLGLSPEVYSQQIRTAFDELKSRWTRSAQQLSKFDPKANLEVYFVSDDPGHSVISTDSKISLVIEPFNTADGADKAMVFSFRRFDELGKRAQWLSDSVDDLSRRGLVPDWSALGRQRDDTKVVAE